MLRIVADLGNSRLKWGRLDETGRLAESIALPLDDLRGLGGGLGKVEPLGEHASRWAISSVNPPLAERLQSFLEGLATPHARWFRSAADVAVRHELVEPETAGADRALAVAAAIGLAPAGRPGLVISCGTAITIERISQAGNLARWRDCARALRECSSSAPSNGPVAAGRAASGTSALGSFDASGRRSGRLLGHRGCGA